MCGRYSLTTPMEAVRQLFDFPERPNLAARVNIAPSQDVAAVRLEEGAAGGRLGGEGAVGQMGLVQHIPEVVQGMLMRQEFLSDPHFENGLDAEQIVGHFDSF